VLSGELLTSDANTQANAHACARMHARTHTHCCRYSLGWLAVRRMTGNMNDAV